MLYFLFVAISFLHNEKPAECACTYPIFYADLSRTIDAPCELPAIIKLDEPGYSNTLTILDCKGSATYISHDMGKDVQVMQLEFSNAEELTTDSIFTYNEETYQETLTVEKYYRIATSLRK